MTGNAIAVHGELGSYLFESAECRIATASIGLSIGGSGTENVPVAEGLSGHRFDEQGVSVQLLQPLTLFLTLNHVINYYATIKYLLPLLIRSVKTLILI